MTERIQSIFFSKETISKLNKHILQHPKMSNLPREKKQELVNKLIKNMKQVYKSMDTSKINDSNLPSIFDQFKQYAINGTLEELLGTNMQDKINDNLQDKKFNRDFNSFPNNGNRIMERPSSTKVTPTILNQQVQTIEKKRQEQKKQDNPFANFESNMLNQESSLDDAFKPMINDLDTNSFNNYSSGRTNDIESKMSDLQQRRQLDEGGKAQRPTTPDFLKSKKTNPDKVSEANNKIRENAINETSRKGKINFTDIKSSEFNNNFNGLANDISNDLFSLDNIDKPLIDMEIPEDTASFDERLKRLTSERDNMKPVTVHNTEIDFTSEKFVSSDNMNNNLVPSKEKQYEEQSSYESSVENSPRQSSNNQPTIEQLQLQIKQLQQEKSSTHEEQQKRINSRLQLQPPKIQENQNIQYYDDNIQIQKTHPRIQLQPQIDTYQQTQQLKQQEAYKYQQMQQLELQQLELQRIQHAKQLKQIEIQKYQQLQAQQLKQLELQKYQQEQLQEKQMQEYKLQQLKIQQKLKEQVQIEDHKQLHKRKLTQQQLQHLQKIRLQKKLQELEQLEQLQNKIKQKELSLFAQSDTSLFAQSNPTSYVQSNPTSYVQSDAPSYVQPIQNEDSNALSQILNENNELKKYIESIKKKEEFKSQYIQMEVTNAENKSSYLWYMQEPIKNVSGIKLIAYSIPGTKFNVEENRNNILKFNINNKEMKINIATGKYSIEELINIINNKLFQVDINLSLNNEQKIVITSQNDFSIIPTYLSMENFGFLKKNENMKTYIAVRAWDLRIDDKVYLYLNNLSDTIPFGILHVNGESICEFKFEQPYNINHLNVSFKDSNGLDYNFYNLPHNLSFLIEKL